MCEITCHGEISPHPRIEPAWSLFMRHNKKCNTPHAPTASLSGIQYSTLIVLRKYTKLNSARRFTLATIITKLATFRYCGLGFIETVREG